MTVQVLHGNNLEVLPTLPDCSVDAVVTDPPYELGFMGKKWDASGIAYNITLWQECLRVLKPGGHLLAFGGTRTYHRMACAIEDAGFEIRDSIHWLYGSGFPKSLDVSKAIDKQAGAEREVIGKHPQPDGTKPRQSMGDGWQDSPDITAPATDEAKQWEGWGTALKPAHEPIVVARKPLVGTVASNVLTYGTGALNIHASRIGFQSGEYDPSKVQRQQHSSGAIEGAFGASALIGKEIQTYKEAGRWPANVVFSHHEDCDDGCVAGCPVAELDQQSGKLTSGANPTRIGADGNRTAFGEFAGQDDANPQRGKDSGGASRFFYCAKPSKRERNAGLDHLEERPAPKMDGGPFVSETGNDSTKVMSRNVHPTVKPLALMRYLVRLVTPPGGTVLDPFAGSGTTLMAATLEHFNAVGIEMTDEYLPIIEGRIAWAEQEAATAQKELPL